MGLRTLTIKAIGPSGNTVWEGSVPKYDDNGQPTELDKRVLDRGIKECVGYSGKYRLVVR